jgi:hypothetical protein
MAAEWLDGLMAGRMGEQVEPDGRDWKVDIPYFVAM